MPGRNLGALRLWSVLAICARRRHGLGQRARGRRAAQPGPARRSQRNPFARSRDFAPKRSAGRGSFGNTARCPGPAGADRSRNDQQPTLTAADCLAITPGSGWQSPDGRCNKPAASA